MTTTAPGTHAVPPRATEAEVAAQRALVEASSFAQLLLASLDGPAAILNRSHQVLAASPEFAAAVGGLGPDDLAGRRPGEILRCARAWTTSAGCGTSPACADCGALQAIMRAAAGEVCRRDCRILRTGNVSEFRLRVQARPLDVRGHAFVVLSFA